MRYSRSVFWHCLRGALGRVFLHRDSKESPGKSFLLFSPSVETQRHQLTIPRTNWWFRGLRNSPTQRIHPVSPDAVIPPRSHQELCGLFDGIKGFHLLASLRPNTAILPVWFALDSKYSLIWSDDALEFFKVPIIYHLAKANLASFCQFCLFCSFVRPDLLRLCQESVYTRLSHRMTFSCDIASFLMLRPLLQAALAHTILVTLDKARGWPDRILSDILR